MFDFDIGKVIESTMEDADTLKEDKTNVASITHNKKKQLYYLLTEEQFKLITSKDGETKNG